MKLKKLFCVFSASMLLSCGLVLPALAHEEGLNTVSVSETAVQNEGEESNVTHSGPLTIESHLKARLGYSKAFYSIYLYAPDDVVGIRINDMDILNGNSVMLSGEVQEVEQGTGRFQDVTVKVTLYYEDRAPYISYETIDVNHWCGVMHTMSEHCTP